MTKTYSGCGGKVVVENGKVIYSDLPYCVVGQKPDMAALKACGWTLVKSPKTYYSHGGTNSTRFTK